MSPTPQSTHSVYILAGARTPVGALNGALVKMEAAQLGAVAIKGALNRSAVDTAQIGEVYMGCVLSAGQGQAPARQAALGAMLNPSTPCTTVNKMCASGLQATIIGYQAIASGMQELVVTGGMESMSNAPYLLSKVRQGLRMGHAKMLDHMFLDGLEDAYEGKLMGEFAQITANEYGLTREQMDAFAIASLEKSLAAKAAGLLNNEIEAVTIQDRKGNYEVVDDEPPNLIKVEKIPNLRPAFTNPGTITAANASSISDGASALVLASKDYVEQHSLQPLARIVGAASFARQPKDFTLAPIGAMEKLLDKIGWQTHEVDLFEINEAFAMVTMLAMQKFNLLADKVNVYGGACAQGHPIGSTGARIVVTLMNALRNKGLKKGIASLCIGGGEGAAIAIEMIDI